MINSFGSKETEKIWNGERVKKIPVEIQKFGRRKLRMLNNSMNIIVSELISNGELFLNGITIILIKLK